MIDAAKGERLLCLARESIKSVLGNASCEYEHEGDKRGVFVTLYLGDELRGCIGFPEPVYPLEKAVVLAAQSAAFEDPRFLPLDRMELEKVRVEVSVLSRPERITAESPLELPQKIKVGTDGLILRSPSGDGLLLPQVAQEYRWSAAEFLENLSIKAGLPPNSWKRPDVAIYKFQAQVFRET